MKITEPFKGEATDSSSRKRRLETILAAWRLPRLDHRAQYWPPPPVTTLSATELSIWFEILRVAQPVPPRTHIEGLKTHARLNGLRIEDLVHDNKVLIIDDRVAVRNQVPGLGLRLHDWSLQVPAQMAGRSTEAILRKRFQEVHAHGDELLASGAWENCTDSVSALVSDALTATTPAALSRLWKLSLALHLEYWFPPALPAVPAKALADLLGEELRAAAGRLTIHTDTRLLRFAAGHDDAATPSLIFPLHLPTSRFTRLLEIEHFFERARYYPGASYYDAIASTFVRIADVMALGNVLLKLEPGSALLAALDTVFLDRPEFIATYVWHPELHAEGAFTLLQLQQRIPLAQSSQLDLKEEWVQVQQLGRELLFLNDRPTDWHSLVAFGMHDEGKALGRRHYGVAGVDRDKVQYNAATLWASAVAGTECARHYVEVLEKHFQAPASDAGIVFALRLLSPLRESGQTALATQLATAIVESYAAMLALDAGALTIPIVLPAYGELLASLRSSLDATGETWKRFLRPFDVLKYLERAQAEQSSTISTSNSPTFVVPLILRAHAEVLVALASAIEAFDEPLQVALELYDADREAELHVAAFSWMALARITSFGPPRVGEPLFVTIGRLFARVASSPSPLEEFVRNESEAHILASLAIGLRPAHPLAGAIRQKLRTLVNVLADEHGLALGHALELANLLQQAGMPTDSERFARRALQILESRLPQGRDAYSPVARAILAGALAQQSRWQELLSFEPQGSLIVISPHARSIENMRALAMLESGRPDEADELLRRILDADPANHTALVNLTAVHLRSGDWGDVIEVAERAKTLLNGNDRDDILINEAHAREKLGDTFGARQLLDQLSGPARTRSDVVAAREELSRGDGASASLPLVEIAAGGGIDAPPLTALLDAVETSQSSDEKGRSLEELMARLFASIEGFQVRVRTRTETEEIDLTILNGSTEQPFFREEALLLVECKNWSSSCGKNEFVIFKEKIENRSQRCSLGFLVSWNGFTQTVTKEMLRGSRERTLIIPLTGEQVRRAVKSNQFAKELSDAWVKAVQT